MAGIDRWLHYTVTTIDRFHCSINCAYLSCNLCSNVVKTIYLVLTLAHCFENIPTAAKRLSQVISYYQCAYLQSL